MYLKKIEIEKYRLFKKIEINFDKNKFSPVFSIASINGGGKSTLLQFIFTMLHCFVDEKKKQFIKNLLGNFEEIKSENTKLAKFLIEEDNKEYELEFMISPAEYKDKNFNLFFDLKDTDQRIQNDKKKIII